MAHRQSAGFSLLELLWALLIVAVLTTLAVPAFSAFSASNKRSSSAQQVLNLLHYARSEAAAAFEITTFCLSDDGTSCDRTGGAYFLLFHDLDSDRTVDAGELIYRETPHVADNHYRLSASNRAYIRYRPTGSVMDFGSVIICPQNRDNHYAARIVVHRSGRPRHGRDHDGDGIVEGSDGNPIDCSAL